MHGADMNAPATAAPAISLTNVLREVPLVFSLFIADLLFMAVSMSLIIARQ